jgi:hypothetical protein
VSLDEAAIWLLTSTVWLGSVTRTAKFVKLGLPMTVTLVLAGALINAPSIGESIVKLEHAERVDKLATTAPIEIKLAFIFRLLDLADIDATMITMFRVSRHCEYLLGAARSSMTRLGVAADVRFGRDIPYDGPVPKAVDASSRQRT